MFQVCGAFAEFEHSMIRQRVKLGLKRAVAQGKKLGRPRKDTARRLAAIRKLRKQGVGINSIARKLGIGVSVVQRIVAAQ
jgi:DNA invertase Pin-like site-specific DNA recombinase